MGVLQSCPRPVTCRKSHHALSMRTPPCEGHFEPVAPPAGCPHIGGATPTSRRARVAARGAAPTKIADPLSGRRGRARAPRSSSAAGSAGGAEGLENGVRRRNAVAMLHCARTSVTRPTECGASAANVSWNIFSPSAPSPPKWSILVDVEPAFSRHQSMSH